MFSTLNFLVAVVQTEEPLIPTGSGSGFQMLTASLIVLALLGLWAWLMRRGVFTKRQQGAVTIETAVPLGERRSLVIVSIEGRRLLLGLTPASVSLVTSLDAASAAAVGFDKALDRADQEATDVP